MSYTIGSRDGAIGAISVSPAHWLAHIRFGVAEFQELGVIFSALELEPWTKYGVRYLNEKRKIEYLIVSKYGVHLPVE